MPLLKTYDLFLSHAWDYSDDYTRLFQMLAAAPSFKFRNYSVPVDKAFDQMTNVQLVTQLDNQIRPVNAVLIISGMYVAYSAWIIKEIELAQKYNKPIIGIKPWGQQRIPQAVQDAADVMVGWTTDSIVSAIRKHAL